MVLNHTSIYFHKCKNTMKHNQFNWIFLVVFAPIYIIFDVVGRWLSLGYYLLIYKKIFAVKIRVPYSRS